MRIHSWFVTLGIVGVSAAATAVGCSSSSSGTTTPGEDASADAASPEDTGTATDTGTPGADGSVVSEAGDAATCSVALSTGSADCDTCAATSCCTQLTTCDAVDEAGADDAGFSQCEGLLACINDFDSADAATDGGGEAACDPSYTADEQANAAAVFTCLRTTCATQCPGL